MKQLLIAFVAALTLGVSVMAKDFTLTACTADHKVAELGVTLLDEAPAGIEAEVRAAFVNAAKGLTAEALQAREGFIAFVSGLSDDDKDNIVALSGVPTITDGTCK